MTDISTRLAALTKTDENALLPCQCGNKISLSHYRDSSILARCAACGWQYSDIDLPLEEFLRLVNKRPREAALIALVQEAGAEIERLRNALHEGLNLCVRARKLDESITAKACRELGSYATEHVKCGTPHLWVLEQYDNDLVAWEQDARKTLNVQGVIS
jgi:hypothetical protein